MGWINATEQKVMRRKFGAASDSMCDGCQKPILGIVYIDPKGGYYPKASDLPDFLPRQPKKTYCQECDEQRRGKKPKPVQENLKKDFAAGRKTGHGTIPSGHSSGKRGENHKRRSSH